MYPFQNAAASSRMANRFVRGGTAPGASPFGTPGGIAPERIPGRGDPRGAKGYVNFGGVERVPGEILNIATPGQMMDYADQLDNYIQGLNQDAVNAVSLDGNVANQFAQWMELWNKFYESLTGVTGFLKRAWFGTADRLVSYREEAENWKAKLSSSGVSVTGPDLPPPPAPSGLTGLLSTVIIGGAVIVGGLVLMKALDFLPKGSSRPALAGFSSRGAAHGYGRRRRPGVFGQLFSSEGKTLLYAGAIGIGLYILYRANKDRNT